MPYQRQIVNEITSRINEPRRFIQIVIGPRQTGKSTAVAQALESYRAPSLFEEATKGESDADWIRALWIRARNLITPETPEAALIIDEVQYVSNWSSVVKTLWDEDTRTGVNLKVLLTGSSATLIEEGPSEALAGRFELIHSTHWSLSECRNVFGYSLDGFLFYGGYPGAQLKRGEAASGDAVISPETIIP